MYNANADHDVPTFKAVSQRWWLFYEIKKFWNCASKTACQKLSFLAGPPFKTIRMIDQEDACYASSACKCSMLCSLVFSKSTYTSERVWYFMDRYLSVTPVDQLRRQLGVKFYSTWYLHWVRSWCVSLEGHIDLTLHIKLRATFVTYLIFVLAET